MAMQDFTHLPVIKDKRKNKSRGNNLEEMIILMEKRADEREEKMIKLFTEIKDRSDAEREHEAKMTEMMLSFMERALSNNSITHPYPYPSQAYETSSFYQPS